MGSSRFQRFKDIMVPLITPGFFSGAIIIFIWAFTDLGTPLLVGFHETVPVYIFNLITNIDDNPVGYALVLTTVLITSLIFLSSKVFLQEKVRNDGEKGIRLLMFQMQILPNSL